MSVQFSVARLALVAGAALAFVGAASGSPALASSTDGVRNCAPQTRCAAPMGVDQQTFERHGHERANDDNHNNRHGRGK